ncbi:uncharacterized protein METZ01_LOCUS393378 [marine metagenome]|uniref:Uncharacterized protein n=1 Tax=marine metagenome TaxID=408172 RepID=A0A382V221_9ZZZZ
MAKELDLTLQKLKLGINYDKRILSLTCHILTYTCQYKSSKFSYGILTYKVLDMSNC